MSITVAKSAGFCFGVDRAVKMAEDILNKISDIEMISEEYISNDSLYREFI